MRSLLRRPDRSAAASASASSVHQSALPRRRRLVVWNNQLRPYLSWLLLALVLLAYHRFASLREDAQNAMMVLQEVAAYQNQQGEEASKSNPSQEISPDNNKDKPSSISPERSISSNKPVAALEQSQISPQQPNIKPKKIPTTPCPVQDCLRLGATPDQQYPNRIVYRHQGGAGLLDRFQLLGHYANLAALLCAKVHVPSPQTWLSVTHNHNQTLSADLHWGDLASFEFLRGKQKKQADQQEDQTAQPEYPRTVWDPIDTEYATDQQATVVTTAETARNRHVAQTIRVYAQDHGKDIDYTGRNKNKNKGKSATTTTMDAKGISEMYQIVQQQAKEAAAWRRGNTSSSPASSGGVLQQQPQFTEAFVWDIVPGHNWKFLKEAVKQQLFVLHEEILASDGSQLSSETTKSRIIPSIRGTFPNTLGCGTYTRFQYPPRLVDLAKLILHRAALMVTSKTMGENTTTTTKDRRMTLPWFGFLHVRRADSSMICNTNLDKMERYFKCSFSGSRAKAFLEKRQQNDQQQEQQQEKLPPFVMLFASDERDASYRQSILTLMEQQGKHSSLVALDVDALIAQVLKDQIHNGQLPSSYNNNYMVFLVGRILAQMSLFVLAQRRTLSCDKCNKDLIEVALKKQAVGKYDLRKQLGYQEKQWDQLVLLDRPPKKFRKKKRK